MNTFYYTGTEYSEDIHDIYCWCYQRWCYTYLVTTSGAIQYGVPTIVDRLLCSADNWAQKPKSAVGEGINKLVLW